MNPLRFPLTAALLACAALISAGPHLSAQQADVRLNVGDSVEVRIFRHDELGGKFTLGPDGSVMLQFIGQVPLRGLTPEQARRKIEALLADGWLRKPEVTVSVTEFAKNFITVDGQVNRPNGFSIARNKPLTITQAIGLAGGFTTRANKKAVLLKRGNKTFSVNVNAIYADPTQDRLLMDGDVLLVQQSIL